MSPRSEIQINEIRKEKKALIKNVALASFANKGFRATTITHIARMAGISKGLMYNYFRSKEDLLSEIIDDSVKEVYGYFDTNRDGFLSEEEFEYFIRKAARLLREKQNFWRLFFQVLMQSEVRVHFLNSFMVAESFSFSAENFKSGSFISGIMKMITDYFIRKSEKQEPVIDPMLELNMFILTIKGFAVTYVYMNDQTDEYYNRVVDRIIELYK
jgi:AcrR family transcriptional regulator